jgi:hypothetical protein
VTADTVESGLVHLFDSGSSDDLDRAVAEAVARRGERGLSADYAARYDHEAIAGQFADEVAARLRGEDST